LIDIHCHILPGLDDGAQTMSDAAAMALELTRARFNTVIATPHVIEGRKYNTPDLIRKKVKELNEHLDNKWIPLKVLPGAENYIFYDLPKWYRQGKILSLADTNKYILIELPILNIPLYTEKVFSDFRLLGLTPIIAHPERNQEIVLNPQRLFQWADKGILIQVNAQSFLGNYGQKVKNLAEKLLSQGLVHFVASDMHNALGDNAYVNFVSFFYREYGAAKFTAATSDNPFKIRQLPEESQHPNNKIQH